MSYSPVPESRRRDGLAVHGARALTAAAVVLGITAVMWVLELVDVVLGGTLDRLGVQAHDVNDLPDIFTAPFMHGSLGHLAGNTLPFVVLGFLAAVRGIGRFLAMMLVVTVVGGLGVWFTGSGNTLGSSILVFGFFGYLLGRGVFERRLADIAIAVGVVAVYGTLIFGILPQDPNISWQGHLFGLIGGVLSAWVLRRRREREPAAPAPVL
ncbi:rhomboid family intramembrane serine protease [Actinomadura parmotrematis]|uniref:Rhomboid family intramembrane serine protease n=1 Tax=Actinomadura parmotrematis TaxID=2864039 RepID=A0ABS7FNV8_9ACTN|nr:rhomboid family intramembrane serine protease [Actinomadura parmotrematis]MBW8482041.1 rhomboid family intramembrane serine protease [Actinomadura parmotrematis]